MELTVKNWKEVDQLAANPKANSPVDRPDEFAQLFRFLRFRKELNPPFMIRKSERPDFILSAWEREKRIGIEVTWAAHQSWEEAQTYLGTQDPKYERISRNWIEGVAKSGKALGQYLQTRQSDPWSWSAGAQAAAKAAEAIHAIQKKTQALGDSTYQRFDENWLLIADRLPFLFLDTDEFCRVVIDLLSRNSLQHNAIYFVTQLRSRNRSRIWKRSENRYHDILFKFSQQYCQIVGCLSPNQGLLRTLLTRQGSATGVHVSPSV
jgi:hypothetical protein